MSSPVPVIHIENVGFLSPYDYEIGRLAGFGAELEVVGHSVDEVLDAGARTDILWIEGGSRLDAALLSRLERTRLLVLWGVGTDGVDLAAATGLGIAVANSPGHCTLDVAEHTLALLLAASRQIVSLDSTVRSGSWTAVGTTPRRLAGSTVGVVGLGRIGRRFAQIVSGLGVRLLGYDPVPDLGADLVQRVELDQLVAESDYVSLHLPANAQTQHLFDSRMLAAMKPGAVLVNTGRGALVDSDALLAALDGPDGNGHLAMACLDVFESEPLPADNPLLSHPRTILTPHAGATSPSSVAALRRAVCDVTEQWVTTGWSAAVVNPEVRRQPA